SGTGVIQLFTLLQRLTDSKITNQEPNYRTCLLIIMRYVLLFVPGFFLQAGNAREEGKSG
ncbi:MAG: hypothetical protein ACOZCL_14355, partial [Bacillota bacterium]